MKPACAVVQAGEKEITIPYPPMTSNFHHEIELVVTIDKAGKDIPIEKLVFSEPLSCAHHCVANLMKYIEADTLKNKDIAIVGAGMTGTLIGLLCKHYGGRITLLNRNESRIKYLKTKNIFKRNACNST